MDNGVEKARVSWLDIKEHALDVYLYQLQKDVSIASVVGGQIAEELVGKARNFVIVLLDSEIVGGQIVGGQPDKVALTPAPTPKKKTSKKVGTAPTGAG